MKIEYSGEFTTGYYNDMEAGYPVFIDGDSLSDIVKMQLRGRYMSDNFCDDNEQQTGILADNTLIGKRVRLTLEWDETQGSER